MYHIKDDARALQSCQCVCQALGELVLVQRYPRISVKALAAKAGVSRTTFYRNFDEIDDVLRYQLDLNFADLFQAVMNYYRQQSAGQKALRTAFVRPFLKFWGERYPIIETVIQAQRESLLTQAFAQHTRRVLDVTKASSFASPEAREYFVAMRSGEAIGLLTHWVKQGRTFEGAALAELVIQQTLESYDMELEPESVDLSKGR